MALGGIFVILFLHSVKVFSMYRLIAFGLAIGLAGCGSGSSREYTDTSKDPEKYAASIKQLVYNQISSAARSKEPDDDLDAIIQELSDQKGRPLGSYKEVYDQILTNATELKKELEGKSKPSNLRAKLDEIKALADKLPGTAAMPKS